MKGWFEKARMKRSISSKRDLAQKYPELAKKYPDLGKQFEIDPYPTKAQYNYLTIHTGLTNKLAGFNGPIGPHFFGVDCTVTFGSKVLSSSGSLIPAKS